jgi:hypothetical protein
LAAYDMQPSGCLSRAPNAMAADQEDDGEMLARPVAALTVVDYRWEINAGVCRLVGLAPVFATGGETHRARSRG